MEKNKNAGNGKFIIVVAIGLAIGIIAFCISLFSILGSKDNDDTTMYQTTQVQNSTTEVANITTSVYVDSEGSTVVVTDTVAPDTQSPQGDNQQGGSDTQGTTSFLEYYEQLSPNGDNKLSDNPDNEFISLVSEKYEVNPELLVAVYSVPDTGVNYVLEFAGSRDSNGNIIKSPDTLSKLYYIDTNRNIKVATRSGIGNEGVDAAEGMLTIGLVQKLVMPQYPDYFTGVNG